MLTATVVSVALPSIASELGASTAAQQWVVNAYLLTVASLILIAPVTATALARVTEDRSGAASGANNAISRTGQLLSVAAVPPLVGLTGEAPDIPERLHEGFSDAMVVAAVLVGLVGVVAALGLHRSELAKENG